MSESNPKPKIEIMKTKTKAWTVLSNFKKPDNHVQVILLRFLQFFFLVNLEKKKTKAKNPDEAIEWSDGKQRENIAINVGLLSNAHEDDER